MLILTQPVSRSMILAASHGESSAESTEVGEGGCGESAFLAGSVLSGQQYFE